MLRILKGTWADVASWGWSAGSGGGYGSGYGYGCKDPLKAGYVIKTT